ncbi:uncharacterized protein LOC117331553 [Pecten maximus]|uniref:uncharacterized protein LOC117331553 n=1 Tax=Pecten maximus TaxID=6579 RepID=UPI0014588A32|nr:uncharacterized protein LOC117331553 [Pecten maximus]
MATSTSQPDDVNCPDDSKDGLVAGLVICVVLLVAVTGILVFFIAKHKGWIKTGRLNFKIPKLRRTGQTNERGNCESSTYQERVSPKDLKSKTTGNMSYDMCLPTNTGTGTRSENIKNDEHDQSAGTRISTVSGRSYLELIVEPDNSPMYENVENTNLMRNKTGDDHKLNVSNERQSDIYINFGSDVSDDKNGGSLEEQEGEECDQIYTNVEISEENLSRHGNSNSDEITGEGGENYFVLEKTDSVQDESYLPNAKNQFEISENYFVLEPQNESDD